MTTYSSHAHAVQADEEQLLLDAIDMAGFGNWTAVSEHVGSKSKEECKVHPSCLRGILFDISNTLTFGAHWYFQHMYIIFTLQDE